MLTKFKLDRSQFGKDQMLSGVDKLVEVEIYIGQATTPAQEKDGHVSNDQKKKPSQESEHELKQVSIKLPKMT